MSDWGFRVRRRLRAVTRRAREIKLIVGGVVSTSHPVMVHIIPIRRCNLSCTYCNEYDDFSQPVGTDTMLGRIDKLAKLGTSIVTLSGGEPLLHPELDAIIARIRSNGMVAGLITNGYLLTRDRVEQLNRAGLDHLQISIDNVQPDDVSKKSLKVLDRKLQVLAAHALFHVNINSVLGAGTQTPEDALVIGRRALQLGFSSTIGIIHDGQGQLKALGAREMAVYEEMKELKKSSFARANYFQENIAHGRPHNWRCRAGSRYLYVCEDGLVHYCSQQRGYPGKRLEDYSVDDIRREYLTAKTCAPYCTISCVNQISYFDFWRGPQSAVHTAQEHEDLVRIRSGSN